MLDHTGCRGILALSTRNGGSVESLAIRLQANAVSVPQCHCAKMGLIIIAT